MYWVDAAVTDSRADESQRCGEVILLLLRRFLRLSDYVSRLNDGPECGYLQTDRRNLYLCSANVAKTEQLVLLYSSIETLTLSRIFGLLFS